ncbi:MAG TPA: hypothetical protein VG347_12235 [Verrucomicrobiae bacterium]|nr:hypothetical protein [Verrucomicrobiae bacterium]
MQRIAIVPGIVAIAAGLALFFYFDGVERHLAAKVQSVQAGQVQPETLTVLQKYVNSGSHGRGWPHVIFRSDRLARINCSTTQQFYDSVSVSNTVAGYYFPDGYYIPGSLGNGAGIAKWIFLGFGLFTGTLLVAVAFIPRKNSTPAKASVQTLLTAIRNRGKSD